MSRVQRSIVQTHGCRLMASHATSMHARTITFNVMELMVTFQSPDAIHDALIAVN
jgi:hypothetical protein